MPRDLGNEIIAAVSAVVVLSFAVTFGILLSTTDSTGDETDITISPTAITEVMESTSPLATEPAPETRSDEVSALEMLLTGQPPTLTLGVIQQTEESIPEETEAPPEATVTPTATATRTRTFTPTASPTRTRTDVPGQTPSPTEFSPTPTHMETAELTCGYPSDWLIYVVQPDESLQSIARAVDSTVAELRVANCVEDVDLISAANELYVPRLPVRPAYTAVPSEELQPVGCNSPLIQIIAPDVGQTVSSIFAIEGVAQIPNQDRYHLEVRADNEAAYITFAQVQETSAHGQLGTMDTAQFGQGVYWIRLSAVDQNGRIPQDTTCAIPVIFG